MLYEVITIELGQLGIGGTGIVHQGGEDLAVQIIDLIMSGHFSAS